jgi:hypothetical protein
MKVKKMPYHATLTLCVFAGSYEAFDAATNEQVLEVAKSHKLFNQAEYIIFKVNQHSAISRTIKKPSI